MGEDSDAAMLAKISQLAGQINRHKNQQEPNASSYNSQIPAGNSNQTPPNSTWNSTRGGYRGRGRVYSRGRGNQVHRNRTLVLNGGSSTTSESTVQTTGGIQDSTTTSPAPAWVTKTDRHLQLINPAIFQKQSQERAKAMEETRRLKMKQRNERERLRFSKHLQRLGEPSYTGPARTHIASSPAVREITIQDIQFHVMKGGSKLMKVSGDRNSAKATPKSVVVAGVRFYRSKNGNLYRSGIVRAQRGKGVIKKIDEPCKAFSTMGTCSKGPRCRYNHDPQKVAICKDFFYKDACTAGDSCDLSHDLTPERIPACLHFAKGNCSNLKCRYSHVHVSPSAPVCRSFGIYGYCDKGANCMERHVNECPDFSNTGTCNTKDCKLTHRHKASVIRKNMSSGDQADDGSSDLSSDEEGEEIDSDDIDSDDLDEELFGEDAGDRDPDIPMQHDYVQF